VQIVKLGAATGAKALDSKLGFSHGENPGRFWKNGASLG
jgi:hypothetical protein